MITEYVVNQISLGDHVTQKQSSANGALVNPQTYTGLRWTGLVD